MTNANDADETEPELTEMLRAFGLSGQLHEADEDSDGEGFVLGYN